MLVKSYYNLTLPRITSLYMGITQTTVLHERKWWHSR